MERRLVLLGVDVGTTNVKACAYDEEGRLLHCAKRPMPTRRLRGGGAEYEARGLERVVFEAVREVIEESGPPEAIGISSMAESGFLIGREGNPLSPAIAWFDQRTIPQANRWKERLPALELFIRTGLRSTPLSTASKLEWVRENEPDVWKESHAWLGMAEYLVFRMTGERVTDPSLACRTMLFDVVQGEWDEELCALAGVPAEMLPPVYQAGATPGKLSQETARTLSVPDGIPVAVCGHDHVCGAFGAGAASPGDVLDSIGTAEACLLTLVEPPLNEAGYELGLPVGCHVTPGLFYIGATLQESGGMVGWLLDLLEGDKRDLARWTEDAGSLSPGGGGVCLPALGEADGGLVFSSLGKESRAGHLLRAALEGLTLEVQFQLEQALKATGASPEAMTLVGGGARNSFWSQLKADASNLPVRVVEEPECVAPGAALLAGIGAGVFPNAESVPGASSIRATLEPSGNHAEYERLYREVHRPLREHVRRARPAGA
ncbi:MAG: FGGY-family carbohydrate kinase [Rubrobacteraceae bacterium]